MQIRQGPSTTLPAWTIAPALALALGCSTTAATPPGGPSVSPPASAEPLASTPAPAQPPAVDTAAATGVAIDPAWVSARPALTAVLRAAMPVCSTREQFLVNPDGSSAHGYSVYAPGLAQAELEQRFRDAAQGLGLRVTRHPTIGLSFEDEANHFGGSVADARLSVILERDAPPREAVRKLAAEATLETWSLLEALGESATWKVVIFERMSIDRGSFMVELAVPPARQPVVEAWARRHGLESIGVGWIRRYQYDRFDIPAIVVEAGQGRLSVQETRGLGPAGPACKEHPTRALPVGPDAGEPKESDDALMRRMMGQ